MAQIHIDWEIIVDRGVARIFLVGLFLMALGTQISSQSVSVTTVYPAPVGAYQQLTVTKTASFARTNGYVGIALNGVVPGTPAALYVNGTVSATNFRMPAAGVTAGQVLTSDAAGGATWQNFPSSFDPNWKATPLNLPITYFGTTNNIANPYQYPIVVYAWGGRKNATGVECDLEGYVSGQLINEQSDNNNNNGRSCDISFWVPKGAVYRINSNPSGGGPGDIHVSYSH